MPRCEPQCCVAPDDCSSCPEPPILHICKEGMRLPVCGLHSVVSGRSTALGVRSPSPARALLPLLLLLAPAFSSVKWAWDKMVPELLSRTDNGILYGFQGGGWPQMHPLHADGALSLVSVTSSALFLQCCLSRPFSEPKGRG